jgi:hypothetical protein
LRRLQLDVSKMRIGQLEYRKEPFDLDGLVQEIVENVQRTTPTHHLMLVKQAHVRVVGDRDRIGQVLINLLTNAIQYSPQADRVLVRMAQDEQHVSVSVQDFGVGIARAHKHKIFDRYYQVSDSGKRPFSGLGLGLYLAHEIIKAHGGSLLLESEEGKGSTFSFTLPVHEQEAEQLVVRRKKAMNNFSQEHSSSPQKDQNPAESSPQTNATGPEVHPSDQDKDRKRPEPQLASPSDSATRSAEDVERSIYPMTSPINSAPAKSVSDPDLAGSSPPSTPSGLDSDYAGPTRDGDTAG